MICPIGADCEAVIYSRYSKFWGIPTEILGLAYYGLIAISYGFFVVWPNFIAPLSIFIILGFTIIAFLFSIYQTFIQAFNLRQWCSWCLISTAICTLILILSLWNTEISLKYILDHYHEFILMLHVVGMALGLGGATIADIFLLRFLKHFRISETESEVLHLLSQFTWFALALIILSGVGLYLPAMEFFNQSPQFLAKMIIVLVIIINGALLNLLIAPRLVQISFGGSHPHEAGELHNLRKISFGLGAVSLSSWYTAFVLGMLSGVIWSLGALLLTYLAILATAVVLSQALEYYFDLDL